jgi:large subunit ribosomal protein L43
MATRGVKQLQKLNIFFCDYGGSSTAIREYIKSGEIVKFATENPTVEVAARLRNGNHPYVKAEYLTGFSKQVCVKNEPVERIEKVVTMLNNSSGRKITKIGSPIKTDTPSVQGVWTPMLEIAQRETFKIEIKD